MNMSIIYQKDKRVGITYAYENKSYWDKEKKQSRSHRTLIGRLDEATGKIVPTRKRKPTVPEPTSKRTYSGATYLLSKIAEEIGIADDLMDCLPAYASQILSVAYYLILEDRNSLTRFSKWAATHKHPYGKELPSQRSSDLFAAITENAKNRFFMLRGKRGKEREYWFCESTSISSYSKTLAQVRYGKDQDHENLAQINIAVLFGGESKLPFYYRKLPGNITDVKTVKALIGDIDCLEYKKTKLVMDRGFYSEDNVNAMLAAHMKFLIGVRASLSYVQDALTPVRENMRNFDHYHPSYGLYAYTKTIAWEYKHDRPYKGDTIEENRRMCICTSITIITIALKPPMMKPLSI
jgi:hypothetical protein